MWENAEHLKSFASISKEWDKNEITKDDTDTLYELLSNQWTSEWKNEIIESLDYNISIEDKDKLSTLLREKLWLVNWNNILTPDKNWKNAYLYKALIWVENSGLSENVLKVKKEEKIKKNKDINEKKIRLDNLKNHTYEKWKNLTRLELKIEKSNVTNFSKKLFSEYSKYITYLNLSDLDENKKIDISAKINESFKLVENIISINNWNLNDNDLLKKDSVLLSVKNIIPEEIWINILDAWISIAWSVVEMQKTVFENIVDSFTSSWKEISNFSEIYNGIKNITTEQWLKFPKMIYEMLNNWWNDEVKLILKYFDWWKNKFSLAMNTVIHIKNFISKIIPKIIRIIWPSKILKILKIPWLALKALKTTKVFKKVVVLSRLWKIKWPIIMKELFSKVEWKINNFAPNKLKTIFAKNGVKSYWDKAIIIQKIKDKILELKDSWSVESANKYRLAFNRLNRFIEELKIERQINDPKLNS